MLYLQPGRAALTIAPSTLRNDLGVLVKKCVVLGLHQFFDRCLGFGEPLEQKIEVGVSAVGATAEPSSRQRSPLQFFTGARALGDAVAELHSGKSIKNI